MKLVVKLSLVLGGLILFVDCGTLWLAYRSEKGRLEQNQDSTLQNALDRLAVHCAAFWGPQFELRCLERMRFTIELTEPESFDEALMVDSQMRVLVHSRFLERDYRLKASPADASYLRLIVSRSDGSVGKRHSLLLGQVRMYSTPVVSKGKRIGTFFSQYRESGLRDSVAWVYQDARRRLLAASLIGAGLGVLLAVGIVFYFLAPLKPLAEASRRVARGDFNCQVPEDRKDELGQLAREFNHMTRRLAELDALKDGFMAKITHDLRNPLAAMMISTDVLLDGYKGPLSPAQEEVLKHLLESGRALAVLIDNILDVTRLEAGRGEFAPEALDLQAAVESVLDLMRPRAEKLQVNLESLVWPDLDEVYADPQALRRVLTNLVSNALNFTPRGGRVKVAVSRGGPDEVLFKVSDTGVGIPPHRIGTLFTKFSQVPETRNKVRPSGGTGLGLVICKEIVEAHGGRIWADSESMKGSAFCFTLPRAKPATPGNGSPSP